MSSVLVTAIGSYAADIVIKNLKKGGFFVVGCDINSREKIANSLETDAFYIAPYVREKESYLNFILDLCRKEKIEYIIPLTDIEVDLLSLHRERLKQEGITVCISSMHTVELCRNKLALERYVSEHTDIRTIPTTMLSPQEPPSFPAVCKPINGRSSEGLRYIRSQEEWEHFVKTENTKHYIVQPYIEGEIICTDIIRDAKNHHTVCIPRQELLRTFNGAGLSVLVFQDEKLQKICKTLAEKLDIRGCVNFEFIRSREGEHYFMECNPRFSGGVVFSCMAGYDCVLNHMRCYAQGGIEDFKLGEELYIARKYTEYITGRKTKEE